MGIDPDDVMNLNSLLIQIITEYQQVIREMNALTEIVFNTIDQPNANELIKATILKVMADTNAQLRKVDFMINTVRTEFASEVKPIVH